MHNTQYIIHQYNLSRVIFDSVDMQIKVKFEYYTISILACEILMAVFILNSKWDVDKAIGITPQSQTL